MHRLRVDISTIRRYSKQFNSLIDIAAEVRKGLEFKRPIVALESTIITHGMPFPQNIETALEVENIVRSQGSIPATIGIINGRIKVGFCSRDFEILGGSAKIPPIKTSRRDFAYVMSKGLNGGTTVSGTIICANLVGIDVFATGGIGGVHRDVETSMDISADLTELGRTSIAVVSSGVKSILDVAKTLEFLETQGVTVTSYQSPENDFPAFYTRKCGVKAPYNVNDPVDAANLIMSAKKLNLNSGILIGVPVPEEFAMNENDINNAISDAIQKAKSRGISGKEVTPFLLSEIGKMTENRSLNTNISLIKNNARVAAQISVQMSKMCSDTAGERNTSKSRSDQKSVVVIGGSILDLLCTVTEYPMKFDGATYHSKTRTCGGGVGRNLAEGLSKLHGHVEFISKVGNDKDGDFLLSLLPIDSQRAIERDHTHHTATCTVIFDVFGESKLTLANMDIHETIDPNMIRRYENSIKQAPLIIFDANLTIDTMSLILDMCRKYNKPAFYEPTDMRFASKLFELPENLINQIKFITPNIHELNAMAMHFGCESLIETNESDPLSDPFFISKVKKASEEIVNLIDNIIVTFGSNGILMTRKNTPANMCFFDARYQYMECTEKTGIKDVQHRFYSVEKLENVMNVSGSGDSFDVGFITAMLNGFPEAVCISVGIESARQALQSTNAVPDFYFTRNHDCWHKPAIHKSL